MYEFRTLTRDTYRRGLKAIANNVDDVTVNPLTYSYDLLSRSSSLVMRLSAHPWVITRQVASI